LIREAKTKRSKGIAYVEFYYFENVVNALSLNNKRMMGQNIYVTRSQSERNRGQVISKAPKQPTVPTKTTKTSELNEYGIIIKNLVNELAKFNKEDITKTFESFGQIEYIDMEVNPKTRLNNGYAIVLYSRVQDAKAAISKMNGYSILGEIMMVEHVPSHMCVGKGSFGEDGEEGGSKIGSSKARLHMMNKFMRGDKIIAQEIGKVY
jgi:RNA-binding protein 39